MRFLHFIVVSFFIMIGTTTMANHILGGNITWTCLGGNQYQIRLTAYADCYGYDLSGGIPPVESIFLIPNGTCSSGAFNADLSFVAPYTQISELCPSELAYSSCSGGVNQGVVQLVYQGTVTIPSGCEWSVVWSTGEWGYFVNTSLTFQPYYVHSIINTNFPCAQSPTVVSTPAAPQIPYVCVNTPEIHTLAINNLPAGYTVQYSLDGNLIQGATIFAAPIIPPGWTLPTGMTISPSGSPTSGNAAINWTPSPTSLGTNVVRIVIEIRDSNGNLVGVINETMTFYVRNCAITDTQFTNPTIVSVGPETTLTGGTNVSVCAGDSLIFTVSATNPNPLRSIAITETGGTGLPLGLVATSQGTNPANRTYKLLTTGAQAGSYTLDLHAQDDACPNPDTDDTTINITIHPNVQLTFSDTTICNGASVNLVAQGLSGNTYNWTVISGDVGSLTPPLNTPTKTVSPSVTTVYRVFGTGIPASCQAADTVTVRVIMTGLTYTKTDETCGNQNGTISLTVNGEPTTGLIYSWTPTAPSVPSLTGLDGGVNYSVTVTHPVYGCTLTQNNIFIDDIPSPTLLFTGDTTICAGGCATLTFDLTQGTPPYTILSGTNLPVGTLNVPLPDGHTITVCPTSTTTYTITSFRDATNCVANVNQSVTVTVRPLVTATFSHPTGSICSGDNLVLNTTFVPAGTYNLTYSVSPSTVTPPIVNPNTISNGPLNVSDPNAVTTQTTYTYDIESVEYTTAPACPSLDAANPPINILVNPLPDVTISASATVCANQCHNFTLSNLVTGTGPWTLYYSINNVLQPTISIPVGSTYAWNVCPTATTTYCLDSISGANGCMRHLTGQCATVTVVPRPSVTNFTVSPTDVCAGQQTTVSFNVNVNSGGPATANYCAFLHSNPSSVVTPTSYCTQVSPTFSLNVLPAAPSTAICLDSVYFGNYSQCATVLNQCITVNVRGNISVTDTTIVCNDIGTLYRATYTLSGGAGTYNEAAGGGTGAFTPLVPTEYVTDWINSGTSGGPWVFTDTYACNTLSITANHTCPVLTNPGTMNLTPISICGTDQATATHIPTNLFLDGNDELMFVLHEGSGTSIVGQHGTNCSTPEFSFNGGSMQYGVTYYISAVAGDLGTPGCVNLAAPNVQVSQGTPVVWYEIPTATISAPNGTSACAGSCVTLNVAVTGQGPWTWNYSVGGITHSPAPPQISATVPGGIHSFCSYEDGIHILTGVSNSHCTGTVSGSVDVEINPLPTASFDGNAATCTGEPHCFEITLTGEAPWTIVIDDPDANNETIPGILSSPYILYCVTAAGDYHIVSVIDANCQNTTPSDTVTLTVNPLPTIVWVTQDTSFCENGTVDLVMAMTGLAPFDINITSPDPSITNSTQNPIPTYTRTVTVGVAGDYILHSVTDANGCESSTGDTVHVLEIATPIANAGPDLDQCVGLPSTIGTPPPSNDYSYTWSSSTGMSSGAELTPMPSVTLNSATTQTYTVTAHVGQCSSTDEMTLTIHGLPQVSITALADTVCSGQCTDIEATSVSGNATYLWTASPSIDPFNTLTDNPITVCPAANETFTVVGTEVHNNASCEAQANISIVVAAPLSVLENYTAQVCNGTCAGQIHLTPSGGFPPYTLYINNNHASLDTVGLCPGIYDYMLYDNIGCIYSNTLTIEERDPEVIGGIDITQPTCSYDLGEININDNFSSYNINGCGFVTTSTTGLFIDVPPCPSYVITAIYEVAPGEVCTSTTSLTIEPISSEITFNAVWTDSVYCYNNQACFAANPTGGMGGLDVEWYNCPELSNPQCYVSTAEPFCIAMQHDTTLYGVAIDQLGCRSDTVMIEAFLNPDIVIDVQGGLDTTSICEFECIDLTAVASGGNGNITTQWFQVPIPQSIGQNPINVCPFFTTTYYAIASDGCSQPVTDTLVVVVHDTPEAAFDVDEFEGCYPLTINFYDLSAPVADGHSCLWSFDGVPAHNNTACDSVVFTYPDYGTFNPTYTITTEFGCADTATLDIPIVVYGKPHIGFTWEPQPVTVIENRVQMVNTTTNAVSYLWTVFGAGSSVQANPEFVLPVGDLATYEVCLEATTVEGCKDTLCQEIFMETVLQVFVPNAFTPDFGDENDINDVFLPIVTGIDPNRYQIWIMNRWGDTVFYSKDPYQAWTGNFNGGDTYVQDGTYVWHIECYDMQGVSVHTFNGTVTIVR